MMTPTNKTADRQHAFQEIRRQKALVKEKIHIESERIRICASELMGPFGKKKPTTPLQSITHTLSEMSYTFRIVKACISLLSRIHRF